MPASGSVKRVKLTEDFTVAVGDTVDRRKLDAAVSEAKQAGKDVKVIEPGVDAIAGFHPGRLNIWLEAGNRVKALVYEPR